MKIEVLETLADGDVLLVRGTVNGRAVEARGWVSATRHHYGAGDYGADGHRKKGAKPRAMTKPEARAYCAALLELAAAPAPQAAPVPVKLF